LAEQQPILLVLPRASKVALAITTKLGYCLRQAIAPIRAKTTNFNRLNRSSQ